jgi:hypothetical protein
MKNDESKNDVIDGDGKPLCAECGNPSGDWFSGVEFPHCFNRRQVSNA